MSVPCRYRTPVNNLVLGDNGWVIHTDNGVHYAFDTTRIMFSQGNITEKIRMANIDCQDETIVDLFAGIIVCLKTCSNWKCPTIGYIMMSP